MAAPAFPLINPDNRLLSWATNDFSLYGGQPVPGTVTTHAPAPANAPTAFSPGSSGDSALPSVANFALSPASVLTEGRDTSEQGAGSAPPPTALHGPDPAAVSPTPEAAPIPQGSSEVLPALASSPVPAPIEDAAQPIPLAADTHPVAGTPHDLTAAAPITPVLDLLATASDHTGTVVTDTLGSVAGIAGHALGGETLDGLGGIDPAGGVTTLVTMVQSADIFDLQTPGGNDGGIILSAASVIDALATDQDAGAALLGDAHHDASPLDAVDLHHDTGGLL